MTKQITDDRDMEPDLSLNRVKGNGFRVRDPVGIPFGGNRAVFQIYGHDPMGNRHISDAKTDDISRTDGLTVLIGTDIDDASGFDGRFHTAALYHIGLHVEEPRKPYGRCEHQGGGQNQIDQPVKQISQSVFLVISSSTINPIKRTYVRLFFQKIFQFF